MQIGIHEGVGRGWKRKRHREIERLAERDGKCSVHPNTYPPSICPSVRPLAHTLIHPSVHPSIHPPFIDTFIHLPLHPFIHSPIPPSICRFTFSLTHSSTLIHMHICICVYPSIPPLPLEAICPRIHTRNQTQMHPSTHLPTYPMLFSLSLPSRCMFWP